MNKTVTINISGIIFHIEEDAYDSLSRYLSTIKGYFGNTDGGTEIMSDIEARIAELLQEKISVSKQVVLMGDVEHVMQIMGKPEEFGADTSREKEAGAEEIPHPGQKLKRRLFRNPDEKAIGGVCSGLAAYFDIDTVWVRLAMFLLIFFGGLSLWVYIIMWIIIPQAKTTADKFAMRGESANINSIFRSFKEETEDVKNRFYKYGKEFKDNEYSSVRDNASRAFTVFFNILGRLFGAFLLFIGTLLLIGYVATLFGISVINNISVDKWKAVIFESSSDYTLAILSFIVVCGVPVFMFIYSGIKLLFRIHYSNRWLNMSLGILWAAGLVVGFYTTVVTVKQFSDSSRIKEVKELHNIGDTLVVKLNPRLAVLKALNLEDQDDMTSFFTKISDRDEEDLDGFLRNHNGGYHFAGSGSGYSITGYANLDVSESSGDSTELVVSRTAHGNIKKDANDNARNIRYNYVQNKNELLLDEIFSVTPGSKFRVQELDMKLKLPKGKVVYFDKSLRNILLDAANVSNTFEMDMVGHYWVMTEKGLKCLDCKNMEVTDDRDSDQLDTNEDKVIINGSKISIEGDDGEQIHIDKNGVKIRKHRRQHHTESKGADL